MVDNGHARNRTSGTRATQARKSAFLSAFVKCGTIRAAAEAAQIGRRTHYDWLDKDESYRVAFECAREDAADMLEDEARRRAVEGIEITRVDKNGKSWTEHRYSDRLLERLLEAHAPDRFGRVTMEHTGRLTHQVVLSDEDKEIAASVAARFDAV